MGELRMRRPRAEALQVNTPTPQMQVLEATLGELAIQAAAADESARGGTVKPT